MFDHRNKTHGLLTTQNPGGLIVPIALHRTTRFPDAAKALQTRNYEEFYFLNYKGFLKSKETSKFEDHIKLLAIEVAEIIKLAPDWNPDWMDDEWFSKVPIDHLSLSESNIPQSKI